MEREYAFRKGVRPGWAGAPPDRSHPMSERSIYLRDQADKCLWHASQMSDPETQAELHKLAVEYIERAAEIEGAEIAAETVVVPSPPSLWLPRLRPQTSSPSRG
jgi:hypothetical protein